MCHMAGPINLLLLTHNYPRHRDDYAGIFIRLLAERISEKNIRPVIISPHDSDLPEREERGGIRIYRFRYAARDEDETLAYRGNMHEQVLGSLSGPFRLRRFLKSFQTLAEEVIPREKIDVIAGHWLIPAGIVMKRLTRRVDVPMMLSSHGTDIRILRKLGKPGAAYFSPLFRRLEHWTVVSSYLRDRLVELNAGLADKLTVLPLPHNEEIFYRDNIVRREDNLVVAVTRFTEQKRVDQLVRAFNWVLKTERSARLEIYGSGPLEATIRDLVSELGLDRQVILHAPVSQSQLREVYNRAAIVVLNSVEEGFGLALSEAMLCGSAVIGTRSGGITDIIEDGKRGLLVQPDSVSDLAEAITRLLSRKEFRRRLAEAGHKFALATYASGPLASRYASLVRSTAEGRT